VKSSCISALDFDTASWKQPAWLTKVTDVNCFFIVVSGNAVLPHNKPAYTDTSSDSCGA
jgi:hypothetical protein